MALTDQDKIAAHAITGEAFQILAHHPDQASPAEDRIIDLSISFPPGSWARSPTKDVDGDDFLQLFPPGALPKGKQFFDWIFHSGDCEFSAGNAWPDTLDMGAFIENELSSGRPLTFRFANPDDAAACYARLLQSGVTAATPSQREALL
ncbi:MAG: hypothetical protein ABSC06_36750 [Rhodopila sp.]